MNFSGIHVMGILNTTPDSFSDGGQFNSLDLALQQAGRMIQQGVDIIDIGGESTRPGAKSVSEQEELDRVIPVIEQVSAQFEAVISIDTSKAIVMKEAVKAGVALINDVRALQEEGAIEVCATLDVPICLMHMQGLPRTMQENPEYGDVVNDVSDFFKGRITACNEHGISSDRLILDPGFGFGKTLQHNVRLLSQFDKFQQFGMPLLAGISRKSMIGALLNDAPVEGRLHGSVSAAVIAAMKGANILRVHDVKETVDAIKIVKAINE